MFKKIFIFALILSIPFLWLRYSSKPIAVARVNDTVISASQIKSRFDKLPKPYIENIKKDLKGFLDKLIADELLYQQALKRDLHKNETVIETIKQARKKILIATLIEREVEEKISISEEDIKAYYQEHIDEFTKPQMLRASHILVKEEEKAAELGELIAGGADFGQLAAAHSIDATRERSGDIGFFLKGRLIPEFEEACSKLKLDEVSGVVKSRYGYHIIKLTGIRESRQVPLVDVRDRIKRTIYENSRKKIFTELVESLKEEATIKTYDDVLEQFIQETK